jgi:glutamate/tyrosine decarboxylase-like PLP-dependent enzyme
MPAGVNRRSPEMKLPTEGVSRAQLRAALEAARERDVDWRNGRVGMYIHYAGEDVLEVAKEAYLAYFSENGLGPRAFPSLAKFENDIVAMSLGLLHGGPEARGAMTVGGTESILLAMKSARDRAHARGQATGTAEVIAANSAHPAFDKAAHLLGMKVTRIQVGKDYKADVVAMEAAIGPDTIMLIGSAPAFPHGVVDPIPELGALARRRKLWLHVDACVGGFSAPFAKMLGVGIPDFDFAVAGVTSMSADLHKYGFSAKGASCVLFAHADDFAFLPYNFSNWQRGAYATKTFVGTRAGGAIAAAWAVMQYLGVEGYKEKTRRILATRQRFAEAATGLGLRIWGEPQLGIISFGADDIDMFAVAEQMEKRGWMVGRLSEPRGLHMMLNLTHEPVVDDFARCLAQSLHDVRTGKLSPVSAGAQY